MFKRRWFSGEIVSEEGFSVLPKRDQLVYREAGRTMKLTAAMGVKGFTVFLDSIARWDDDLQSAISLQESSRIAENVRRAPESQGQEVEFES